MLDVMRTSNMLPVTTTYSDMIRESETSTQNLEHGLEIGAHGFYTKLTNKGSSPLSSILCLF